MQKHGPAPKHSNSEPPSLDPTNQHALFLMHKGYVPSRDDVAVEYVAYELGVFLGTAYSRPLSLALSPPPPTLMPTCRAGVAWMVAARLIYYSPEVPLGCGMRLIPDHGLLSYLLPRYPSHPQADVPDVLLRAPISRPHPREPAPRRRGLLQSPDSSDAAGAASHYALLPHYNSRGVYLGLLSYGHLMPDAATVRVQGRGLDAPCL